MRNNEFVKKNNDIPTEVEKVIVEMLSLGFTHAHIGEKLEYAKRTIDSKVYDMLKKYTATNSIHLTRIFITKKWIVIE